MTAMTDELTPSEKKFAAAMLDLAANTFSNHGCNDYEIPNTQENVDMLNLMEQWNVGKGNKPEEVYVFDPKEKTLDVPDWYLMRYLSARLLGDENA